MKIVRILAIGLLLCAMAAAAQTSQQQCANAIASPSVQLTSGLVTFLYTDTTPVDGAIYAYVVIASNAMGGYSCSNIVLNTVIPATGTHTVALSWQPSSTNGVTYAVFRAQNPANPSGLTATVN